MNEGKYISIYLRECINTLNFYPNIRCKFVLLSIIDVINVKFDPIKNNAVNCIRCFWMHANFCGDKNKIWFIYQNTNNHTLGRFKIMNAVFYWSSMRFFPERVTAFVRNVAVPINCVMRITIFCLHSHAPHDMILILKRSKNIWYHS